MRDDLLMVTIGLRIEFYEKPSQDPAEPSQGYLGHVRKEEAYTALAVPGVGDSVGTISITAGSGELTEPSPPSIGGRHVLRVQDVEHHFEPPGSAVSPTIIVVLHTSLYSGEILDRFVRNYMEAGWLWEANSPDLASARDAARRAMGQ